MIEPRFAILAPPSENELIGQILRDHGHDCLLLDPGELVERIKRGAIGVLVVAAESLDSIDHAALRLAIEEQPPWTDLPILLLVDRSDARKYAPLLDKLGQVRIVERPIEQFILERSALTALRSRGKQSATRALMDQLEEVEASYRALNETLEQRIGERTRQLEAAYDRLLREGEERRAAEERYRLAAHATNDAIWDLDLIGDQVHWAPSASGFFGYADIGDTTPLSWWEEQLHPDDRRRVSASLSAAIAGKSHNWAESYRFRRADGEYADVEDQGFIIRDEGGRAVRAVGAMSDITERRRAEAELGRMQSDLIHVARLSAMGAMASTLAHEINQPLTAITNYLRGSRRMLESLQGERLPEIKEALEAAEAGALRAGQIVRRLRELVARGNVSMRTEDLPRLIEEACVLGFLDSHLLRIAHRVETDPEARWVYADRIQIQQVLINLIRNAIQAMSGQPEREITISTSRSSSDMVEVSVEDTGAGVSDEIREALFSPFQSTKAEGMGIGLSISRTIVEAHGGRIWAEDRTGGGAIFRFTLPLAEEICNGREPNRAVESSADPL